MTENIIFEQPVGDHGELTVQIARNGNSPKATLIISSGVQVRGEVQTRSEETGTPATNLSETADQLFNALKAYFRTNRIAVESDSKTTETEGALSRTVTLTVGKKSREALEELAEDAVRAVTQQLSLTRYAITTDEQGGKLAGR